MESGKTHGKECHLGGVIIRSLTLEVSNYRSTQSLPEYCAAQGVIGIANLDTRELTRRLRDNGALVSVISTDSSKSDEELVAMAKGWKIEGKDYLSEVSCEEPYEWSDPTIAEWEFNMSQAAEPKFHVVAYDFGIKTNILRRLASYGACARTPPHLPPHHLRPFRQPRMPLSSGCPRGHAVISIPSTRSDRCSLHGLWTLSSALTCASRSHNHVLLLCAAPSLHHFGGK